MKRLQSFTLRLLASPIRRMLAVIHLIFSRRYVLLIEDTSIMVEMTNAGPLDALDMLTIAQNEYLDAIVAEAEVMANE